MCWPHGLQQEQVQADEVTGGAEGQVKEGASALSGILGGIGVSRRWLFPLLNKNWRYTTLSTSAVCAATGTSYFWKEGTDCMERCGTLTARTVNHGALLRESSSLTQKDPITLTHIYCSCLSTWPKPDYNLINEAYTHFISCEKVPRHIQSLICGCTYRETLWDGIGYKVGCHLHNFDNRFYYFTIFGPMATCKW